MRFMAVGMLLFIYFKIYTMHKQYKCQIIDFENISIFFELTRSNRKFVIALVWYAICITPCNMLGYNGMVFSYFPRTGFCVDMQLVSRTRPRCSYYSIFNGLIECGTSTYCRIDHTVDAKPQITANPDTCAHTQKIKREHFRNRTRAAHFFVYFGTQHTCMFVCLCRLTPFLLSSVHAAPAIQHQTQIMQIILYLT